MTKALILSAAFALGACGGDTNNDKTQTASCTTAAAGSCIDYTITASSGSTTNDAITTVKDGCTGSSTENGDGGSSITLKDGFSTSLCSHDNAVGGCRYTSTSSTGATSVITTYYYTASTVYSTSTAVQTECAALGSQYTFVATQQ